MKWFYIIIYLYFLWLLILTVCLLSMLTVRKSLQGNAKYFWYSWKITKIFYAGVFFNIVWPFCLYFACGRCLRFLCCYLNIKRAVPWKLLDDVLSGAHRHWLLLEMCYVLSKLNACEGNGHIFPIKRETLAGCVCISVPFEEKSEHNWPWIHI